MAAIFREAGWKWGIFSITYLTSLAWVVATLFYQTAQLTVNPQAALIWITICVAILATFVTVLKVIGKSEKNLV
jgi:ferrous iron transport protein B